MFAACDPFSGDSTYHRQCIQDNKTKPFYPSPFSQLRGKLFILHLHPPCAQSCLSLWMWVCCKRSIVWLHSRDGPCTSLNTPCCLAIIKRWCTQCTQHRLYWSLARIALIIKDTHCYPSLICFLCNPQVWRGEWGQVSRYQERVLSGTAPPSHVCSRIRCLDCIERDLNKEKRWLWRTVVA